ncbi:hypothetical protein DPEC_G00137720 [Dallia pectoralis]|uniref:Uncharacterized protein n=1 Tax=Dallia pectoralis TaxID=75939 RepID=A0ACC2GLS8_DALPE|nr:hypothetical protein DPEC_G00137720 [Dallia pectoralis]
MKSTPFQRHSFTPLIIVNRPVNHTRQAFKKGNARVRLSPDGVLSAPHVTPVISVEDKRARYPGSAFRGQTIYGDVCPEEPDKRASHQDKASIHRARAHLPSVSSPSAPPGSGGRGYCFSPCQGDG